MGKLICMSGLDGSGKSTMCTMLTNYLQNYNVIKTQFLEKSIGLDSNRMAINFLKKNKSNFKDCEIISIRTAFEIKKRMSQIEMLLKEDKLVITDRFIESFDLYRWKNNINTRITDEIIGKIPQPSIHIYIRTKPEICYERIINRSLKIEWDEELDELKKAEGFYLNNFDKYQFIAVDGNKSIDLVFEDIKKLLRNCSYMKKVRRNKNVRCNELRGL